MNSLALSLRLLARQGRSGAMLMLLLALAVATAAMSSVGLFTDRVARALERNAAEILAGDLVIASRQQVPEELAEQARQAGLDTARTVTASTVVFVGDESNLVEVKGVTEGYPLRGTLRLGEFDETDTDRIPATGTAWADNRALRALEAEPGDRLEVGSLELEIAEILAYEPDRAGGMGALAPRVMIHMDDLEASGLLGAGARSNHRLLMAGRESDVDAFRSDLSDRLESGQRILTVGDAEDQTAVAMEQARRFLSMAALTAVILAAVATLLAARRYSDQQRDLVALLKSFGASSRKIFLAVGLLLLWVALTAAIIGISTGWLAQSLIAQILAGSPAGELPPAQIGPALWAGVFTGLLALGFALPALVSLGGVPPMRILNRSLDQQSPWWRLAYGLAIAAALAIPAWQLSDWRLVTILLGGSLVLAGVLAAGGLAVMVLTRKLAAGAGPAWRIGLSGLDRRRGAGILQITALGLGLMALLLLLVVRGELLDQWRGGLPEGTPNHFLVNIQPEQRDSIIESLEQAGAETIQLRPMATGRLTRINDQSTADIRPEDPMAERRLQGQVNLSWTNSVPPANEIIAGEFWDSDDPENQISLAETWAEGLDIGMGDELVFEVGGEEFGGPVTSIRRVDWNSFNVNFFILITPEMAETIPHQIIGSFYLPAGESSRLRDLAREHSNVSLLDVDSILNRVREIIDRVSMAAQVVFFFTLAAGLVVLLAALQSTRDERRHEAALIRTLGADKGLVLRSVLVEYAAMAAIAGLLATLGAGVTGWLLARELFGFAYMPSAGLFVTGIGASLILVVGAGWAGNRSVLTTPPVRILRAGG